MFKKLLTTGINGLMMVLLLGLFSLPITSLGLSGVRANLPNKQVLSAMDQKSSECTCPKLIITPEMEREIYERILKEEKEKELLKAESIENNEEKGSTEEE